MNHYIKTNFGIHSFNQIPSVCCLSKSVNFTARFLDSLSAPASCVLILHYKLGNGLIQCFQIIDSIETWKLLGRIKTLKVCGLYSLELKQATKHSETFTEKDKRISLCRKIVCPRCEKPVNRYESLSHTCKHCNTRFTTRTK